MADNATQQTDISMKELARFKRNHDYFQEAISKQVVGYNSVVTDLLISLLAEGNVLLEGVPGTAKTTLCKTFADTLGMSFKRVQFTQDLMPMDITGHNYFNQETKKFEIRPGPVFTNILLADEINRAPPKTQSAMFECMEEKQCTIEGKTFKLQRPFMVVATMNPVDSEGVYRLPEAQLDRFTIRSKLHYLPDELEQEIIRIKLHHFKPEEVRRLKADAIVKGQDAAKNVRVTRDVLAYMQQCAARTRDHPDVQLGASPRAMGQILRVSQSHALISGRPYVSPEDVLTVIPKILSHRVILKVDAEVRGQTPEAVIAEVMSKIPKPADPATGQVTASPTGA